MNVNYKRCGCNTTFLPTVRTQGACSACDAKAVAKQRDHAVSEGFGLGMPGAVVERGEDWQGRPEYFALVDVVSAAGVRLTQRFSVPFAAGLIAGLEMDGAEMRIAMKSDVARGFDWTDATVTGLLIRTERETGKVRLITHKRRDAILAEERRLEREASERHAREAESERRAQTESKRAEAVATAEQQKAVFMGVDYGADGGLSFAFAQVPGMRTKRFPYPQATPTGGQADHAKREMEAAREVLERRLTNPTAAEQASAQPWHEVLAAWCPQPAPDARLLGVTAALEDTGSAWADCEARLSTIDAWADAGFIDSETRHKLRQAERERMGFPPIDEESGTTPPPVARVTSAVGMRWADELAHLRGIERREEYVRVWPATHIGPRVCIPEPGQPRDKWPKIDDHPEGQPVKRTLGIDRAIESGSLVTRDPYERGC